ncbi:hypothetical protein TGMAS_414020, partial [Toxoplasma gondii MAS]
AGREDASKGPQTE